MSSSSVPKIQLLPFCAQQTTSAYLRIYIIENGLTRVESMSILKKQYATYGLIKKW